MTLRETVTAGPPTGRPPLIETSHSSGHLVLTLQGTTLGPGLSLPPVDSLPAGIGGMEVEEVADRGGAPAVVVRLSAAPEVLFCAGCSTGEGNTISVRLTIG